MFTVVLDTGLSSCANHNFVEHLIMMFCVSWPPKHCFYNRTYSLQTTVAIFSSMVS